MTERKRRALPPAPSDLSEGSQSMWVGYATDLRTIERDSDADYEALHQALIVRDRLELVGAKLTEQGVSIDGSTGQQKANGLLYAEQNLRRELRAALESLGLLNGSRYAIHTGPDGRLRHTAR